ncbi:MAG: gamma-glutamylcyclotransferase family protein [Phaeodactylibacter sp.]|uniref:gamma-glutamylcyclotransferase family protein n=1 Tax=Phaeodactylibacter sp. TaxID=1940289 RepID=UPI0032ED6494
MKVQPASFSPFLFYTPSSMPPLFVYGTLLFPEILATLLNRVPHHIESTLIDHRRFAIHDGPKVRPYPAIFPEPGAVVSGHLLPDLSPRECQILDAYEGADYAKTTGQVKKAGQWTEAEVYIWRADKRGQLRDSWEPEYFQAHHLGTYLRYLALVA